MEKINFKIRKFNLLDCIFLFLTLPDVGYFTGIGEFRFSLIGILMLIVAFYKRSKVFAKPISIILFLLSAWFIAISIFIGSSVLGNLLRVILCCFGGMILTNLLYEKNLFLESIKKVFYFHIFFLFLDFLFDVPWGWDNSQFYFSLKAENYYRARGLFAEPSHFGIYVNTLFLLLLLEGKAKFKEGFLLVSSCILSASGSAILTAILMILFAGFKDILKDLRLSLSFEYLSKRSLIILCLLILIVPIILTGNGTQVFTRLSNPLDDNSILTRTFGSIFKFFEVLQTSPIFGYGIGETGEGQTFDLYDLNINYGDIEGNSVWFTSGNHITFVSMMIAGGLVALILFTIYVLLGFGFGIYLIPFLFISFSSGAIWDPLIFLIPSFAFFFRSK